MACFVSCYHNVDDLLQEQVPVRFAAIRALVVGLGSTGLQEVALDTLWHNLFADGRILEHAVAVYMDKHLAPATLDHVLTFDHMDDSLVVCALINRLVSRISLVTRLEPFADWAKQLFVSHLVALVAQFEVFAPFVVTFGASRPSLAILTLDTVLTAEALRPNIELLDFSVIVLSIRGDRVQGTQRLLKAW